jgi:hypothetical protein
MAACWCIACLSIDNRVVCSLKQAFETSSGCGCLPDRVRVLVVEIRRGKVERARRVRDVEHCNRKIWVSVSKLELEPGVEFAWLRNKIRAADTPHPQWVRCRRCARANNRPPLARAPNPLPAAALVDPAPASFELIEGDLRFEIELYLEPSTFQVG